MLARHSRLPKPQVRRICLPNTSSYRQFHQSKALNGPLIDTCHAVFQNVHAFTGLPWALTIPLTGALFRLAFAPILYISSRASKERISIINPLRSLHGHISQQRLVEIGRQGKLDRSDAVKLITDEQKNYVEKLQKEYKQRSRVVPIALELAFLPVFFTGVVVLQTMVGSQSLLSFFVDKSTLPPLEAGLSSQGFLYLDSLTVPDPFFILPLAVGGLLWLSMGKTITKSRIMDLQTQVNLRPPGPSRSKAKLILFAFQFMRASPAIIPIVLLNSPAALALFMCGTSATQSVLKPLVRHLAGARDPISHLTPRVPRLKSQYQYSMHKMDVWRPPQKTKSSAAASAGPVVKAALQTPRVKGPVVVKAGLGANTRSKT